MTVLPAPRQALKGDSANGINDLWLDSLLIFS